MDINKILSDSQGDPSSMRYVMVIVIAIILVKNIAFNVANLIHGGSPVAFDMTDVAMILSVVGGKVAQVFGEIKKGGQ